MSLKGSAESRDVLRGNAESRNVLSGKMNIATMETANPKLQEKSVTPTEDEQNVAADRGYDGLYLVKVGAIPDEYVVPSGTEYITENGEYNVAEKEIVNVDIEPAIPDGYLKPEGTLDIVDNGEHSVGEYEKVNVNVPAEDSSDATAENEHVVKGETYYADGEKQTGTMQNALYETAGKWKLNPASGGGASVGIAYRSSKISYLPASPTADYTVGVFDVENLAPQNIKKDETVLGVKGEYGEFQEKTVTTNGEVTADSGYDGLSKVIVNVSDIAPTLQEKTLTPTKEEQNVVADSGYDGLSKVTVEPIPDEYIEPSGEKSITSNGSHDVTKFESVDVNVPIPDGYIVPSGTKSITENGTHDVTEHENVSVNVPIPDGYIEPEGSLNITENGSHNVTEYESVQVDVPIPDGYIVPSGTKHITENGTHDITNHESVIVNVPIPEGYIDPEGELKITENGVHEVAEYESVNINVPIPEGYIEPEGELNITENGSHNVTEYESVDVNVPIPDGYIVPSGTKPITANGVHDVTEHESVNVNVPIPDGYLKPTGTFSITKNGEHSIGQYDKVNVNVPVPDGYLDTSDATATEADVVANKTFYADNVKKKGSMPDASSGGVMPLITKSNNPTAPEGTLEVNYLADKTTFLYPSSSMYGGAFGTVFEDSFRASNIKKNVTMFGLNGEYEGEDPKLQEKTVVPSEEIQTVTADSGNDGLSKVVVEPIPSQYVVPSGSKRIFANGTHDVAGFESVEVNVAAIDKMSGIWQFKKSMGFGNVAITQELKVYGGLAGFNPPYDPYGDGVILEYDTVILSIQPTGPITLTVRGLNTRPDYSYVLLSGHGETDYSCFADDMKIDLGEVPQEVSTEFRSWASVYMNHVSGGASIGALQDEKIVVITEPGTHEITADDGYDGVKKITVEVDTPTGSATVEEWNAETAYEAGDIVLHEGTVYKCIIANTAQEPTILSSGYWERVNTYEYVEDFLTHPTYNEGVIVKYNGSIYLCVQETNLLYYPDRYPEYWEKLNDDTAGGAEDLTDVLTEQDELIDQIKTALTGKDGRDKYQRVEYIESAEAETYPYIITDFIADNSCGMEIVASFPILQDRIPMGSRENSDATRFYCVYPMSANSIYYGFNTGSSISCQLKVDTIYRCQTNFLNSRLISVYDENGIRKGGTSISATLVQQSAPVSIFGYHSASSNTVSSKREYKLYSARCSKGHEVVREYIPCYRKSDGVVGVYEKFTGQFLTSEVGSFAKGADIEW